jgi:hypothetical protein
MVVEKNVKEKEVDPIYTNFTTSPALRLTMNE